MSMVVKKIICQIDDELEGACEYAEDALLYKDQYPDLAKVYAELSKVELSHADKLHEQVADMIEEYQKKSGEPPAGMMAIYEYQHEKAINKVKEIQLLQSRYK